MDVYFVHDNKQVGVVESCVDSTVGDLIAKLESPYEDYIPVDNHKKWIRFETEINELGLEYGDHITIQSNYRDLKDTPFPPEMIGESKFETQWFDENKKCSDFLNRHYSCDENFNEDVICMLIYYEWINELSDKSLRNKNVALNYIPTIYEHECSDCGNCYEYSDMVIFHCDVTNDDDVRKAWRSYKTEKIAGSGRCESCQCVYDMHNIEDVHFGENYEFDYEDHCELLTVGRD